MTCTGRYRETEQLRGRRKGGCLMRHRVAMIMVVALVLAGAPSVTQASESPASVPVGLDTAVFHRATHGPIVASGRLTGGDGAIASGWVALLAWPTEQVLRRVPVGESVKFPTVGWARTDGSGRFQVRLDPTLLPDGYLSDTGQADVDVLGWTGDGMATVHFSAQLGTPDREQAAAEASIAAPASIDVRALLPLHGTVSTTADSTASVTPLIHYCDGTRVGTYKFWTRVAETWPYYSTSTGWVELSSSHSVTVGVGVTLGSTWSESGTHTTTAGYSWTPTPSTLYREYDVEMAYGKWYYSCTWEYDMYPDGPTGGAKTVSISYQGKWSSANCAYVGAGVWKREDSSYSAYALSGGVKSSSIIGIGLSVNTNYSTTSNYIKKTVYSLQTWSYLCGSNAYPSRASRITDIGHNTP